MRSTRLGLALQMRSIGLGLRFVLDSVASGWVKAPESVSNLMR